MVVAPLKPLQSILMPDFISNNSAKKLLKSVHAFQFLTHLQGKSEQPQRLHHSNPLSAYNHTQDTQFTVTGLQLTIKSSLPVFS